MKKYEGIHYVGERPLFMIDGAEIRNCLFDDGESPLKECKNLIIRDTTFGWRYPLWYGENFDIKDTKFLEGCRASIWYTNNLKLENVTFDSVKSIRRCSHVSIKDVAFNDAVETVWECSDVHMENVFVKGDYILMNCQDVTVKKMKLIGKYSFDGCRNIVVEDSDLDTKDAFWNCKNVVVRRCRIKAEYIAWNTENITFEDCEIESLQGFCYIKNLKMRNCRLVNTTLAFEYSTIDVELDSAVDSVKNPISGRLRCKGIGELIFDDPNIDPSKTDIVVE